MSNQSVGRQIRGAAQPRGGGMKLRDIPARIAVTAVLWAVGALFLVVECLAGCGR